MGSEKRLNGIEDKNNGKKTYISDDAYILVLEPRECQSCVVGCYDVVALSD